MTRTPFSGVVFETESIPHPSQSDKHDSSAKALAMALQSCCKTLLLQFNATGKNPTADEIKHRIHELGIDFKGSVEVNISQKHQERDGASSTRISKVPVYLVWGHQADAEELLKCKEDLLHDLKGAKLDWAPTCKICNRRMTPKQPKQPTHICLDEQVPAQRVGLELAILGCRCRLTVVCRRVSTLTAA